MATIIKTIDDIKEYVSVNKNIDFTSIRPYVIQAERKYVEPLTGSDMHTAYSDAAFVPEGNEKKVYELLREASANLAWFLYLPLANVQVTDSGISVSTGNNHKAAEWWQIRDLRRSFLDAGFTALDDCLKIMESNEEDFEDWKSSTSYTVFKELFVKRTDTFQRWFNIGNSRKTFLALRPYMLEAHHQYFTARLNAPTIARINNLDMPPQTLSFELAGSNEYRVLEHLQASMVGYAVAKAIKSGTFELTANGIYEKLEEFPGYKAKTLDDVQVNRTAQERLIAAEEHYKKALKLIKADTENFPEFESRDTTVKVSPYNGKSIVSF